MNSVLEQSTSEKWDSLLIKTANCWRRLQSFTGLISNWWKLFNFKHILDIYLSFSLYSKLWCAAKVKFCQIKEKYNEEIDCDHFNKVNLLSWNYENLPRSAFQTLLLMKICQNSQNPKMTVWLFQGSDTRSGRVTLPGKRQETCDVRSGPQ